MQQIQKGIDESSSPSGDHNREYWIQQDSRQDPVTQRTKLVTGNKARYDSTLREKWTIPISQRIGPARSAAGQKRVHTYESQTSACGVGLGQVNYHPEVVAGSSLQCVPPRVRPSVLTRQDVTSFSDSRPNLGGRGTEICLPVGRCLGGPR